mmetsp:Transcript_38835/g.123494  ORF Transcript_38835/g.123494 Transcript_38835/m.123494 type:complete len:204 (-) Transcript_38835:123-734(-)
MPVPICALGPVKSQTTRAVRARACLSSWVSTRVAPRKPRAAPNLALRRSSFRPSRPAMAQVRPAWSPCSTAQAKVPVKPVAPMMTMSVRAPPSACSAAGTGAGSGAAPSSTGAPSSASSSSKNSSQSDHHATFATGFSSLCLRLYMRRLKGLSKNSLACVSSKNFLAASGSSGQRSGWTFTEALRKADLMAASVASYSMPRSP